MRVLVTGGTGLVGRRLVSKLLERGDEVNVLTRQEHPNLPPTCRVLAGDPAVSGDWLEKLPQFDSVIHLAGENVFAHRWSKRFKKRLYDSRVDSTKLIAEKLAKDPLRSDGAPKVLVSASAIGYYGPHANEELDEDSPPGRDFLAQICVDWEKANQPAKDAGVRVSNIRIAMVLDENGGALTKMIGPFRWYVGGPVGNGKQWISWIHIADLVDLILLANDRSDVSGPINGAAPEPLTNWGFSKALAKVLNRPCWLPVPAFMVRLLIGEAASVVVRGQRVLPRRALKFGYEFRYPDLELALRDLLKRPAA